MTKPEKTAVSAIGLMADAFETLGANSASISVQNTAYFVALRAANTAPVKNTNMGRPTSK